MSATLESQEYAQYFAVRLPSQPLPTPAPVLSVEGRVWPVMEFFLDDLHHFGNVCVCVRTRWMCVIVGGTRRNTCTAVDHCIPYSVFFSSHVKYHFAKFAPLKSRPPLDKMGRNIKHIPRNGAMGFVRGLYNVHPVKKIAIRYICIKKSLMYVCMYVHVYTCVVGGGPEC